MMRSSEAALVQLWGDKCGLVDPDDNLVVQLGVRTEALNRNWQKRIRGKTVECVQLDTDILLGWPGTTLDGIAVGKRDGRSRRILVGGQPTQTKPPL
jgi:hypothetical protein